METAKIIWAAMQDSNSELDEGLVGVKIHWENSGKAIKTKADSKRSEADLDLK